VQVYPQEEDMSAVSYQLSAISLKLDTEPHSR